jgi:hypothetical protein
MEKVGSALGMGAFGEWAHAVIIVLSRGVG